MHNTEYVFGGGEDMLVRSLGENRVSCGGIDCGKRLDGLLARGPIQGNLIG